MDIDKIIEDWKHTGWFQDMIGWMPFQQRQSAEKWLTSKLQEAYEAGQEDPCQMDLQGRKILTCPECNQKQEIIDKL